MNVREEKSPLMESPPSAKDQATTSKYKTFKTRWYILLVFTGIALISNMVYITWGPISEPCEIVLGWANWQIIFITTVPAICFILCAVPSTWILDTRGLRASVVLCAFLLTVGKVLHVIPTSDPLTRTILLNIGQFISSLNIPVALGAPSSISSTWFPPEERTTATAISTLVAYLGLAFAFIIGPNMVPVRRIHSLTHENINASFTKHTVYDIETMSTNLTKYMAVQLGMSAILLICVLVYFPDKPPLPPCATSSSKPSEFMENIKALLSDRSYLFLALLFGLSYGTYFGWLPVLTLAVQPFGIKESLAGWIGTAASLAGIFSGVCIAKVVDYVKRHTKTVLIFLFLGTTISQLLFTLTCSRIIPFSKPLLFSSIILGGLFFNSTTPLVFEMAVETVFPVAQGLTVILLLKVGCFVVLVFLVAFMFPWMNVAWMNWCVVISNGLCVPGLLVYKNKFKRLDLE